jgi:hypothetical protein
MYRAVVVLDVLSHTRPGDTASAKHLDRSELPDHRKRTEPNLNSIRSRLLRGFCCVHFDKRDLTNGC